MTGITIERQQLGPTLSRVIVALLLVGVGVLGGLGLAQLAPRTGPAALIGATGTSGSALSADQAYRIHQTSERAFALPVSADQAYRIHQTSERAFALPVSADQAYRIHQTSERANPAP